MSGQLYILRPTSITATIPAGGEFVFGPDAAPLAARYLVTQKYWAGFTALDDSSAGNFAVYYDYNAAPYAGNVADVALTLTQGAVVTIDPVWNVAYDTFAHFRNMGVASRTLAVTVYIPVPVLTSSR